MAAVDCTPFSAFTPLPSRWRPPCRTMGATNAEVAALRAENERLRAEVAVLKQKLVVAENS